MATQNTNKDSSSADVAVERWAEWWDTIVEVFQHVSIVSAILVGVWFTGWVANTLLGDHGWINEWLPSIEQFVALGLVLILSFSLAISFAHRYIWKRIQRD
jgi:hypothetical protein